MGGRRSKHAVQVRLLALYHALFRAFGPQHWWPGETPFEVMVGAVLTQNTAWTNVEKAIANLKREKLLTPARLHATPSTRLASLIRPSGYFNVKTKRLKSLTGLVTNHYRGRLSTLLRDDPVALRQNLLGVNGIGPETADSILLYAAGRPVFVVDAYTKRIMGRHGLVAPDADYHRVQELFMGHLRPDTALYNEYHALIVRTGKEFCRKTNPQCEACPLRKFPHRASSAGATR